MNMNEVKMRNVVTPAEDLHLVGMNNNQKVEAPFVNPGVIEAPLVQKSDLEDPQVSAQATNGLRGYVGGGQDLSRNKGY